LKIMSSGDRLCSKISRHTREFLPAPGKGVQEGEGVHARARGQKGQILLDDAAGGRRGAAPRLRKVAARDHGQFQLFQLPAGHGHVLGQDRGQGLEHPGGEGQVFRPAQSFSMGAISLRVSPGEVHIQRRFSATW
jgi:hypothetical protein